MKAYIEKCTCKHEGQDELHGDGMRVMNVTQGKAGDGNVEVRCTVCHAKKIVKK